MQVLKSSFCLIVALLLLVLPLKAQNVTTNIYTRVFLLKYQNSFGSSFTIEVDDKQYLITAGHIITGMKDGDNIEIMQNNTWQTLAAKLIQVKPEQNDIAVLALPKQISPTLPITVSIDGITLAQAMYFLGFPYGLKLDGKFANNGFPLPLVKQGICSGIINAQPGETIILLDGFNNSGFSGGPIVYFNQNTKALTIAGMVNGYRNNLDKVLRPGDKSKGEPDLVDTGNVAITNSGIVIGHSIEPAIESIKRNPIGVKVSK